MSQVSDCTRPCHISSSLKTPPVEISAVPPGDAAAGDSDATFHAGVPVEDIVFRPKGWAGSEGAPPPCEPGTGDSSFDDLVDEVMVARKSPIDGVDGTQRRFWVAPPQGEQTDGGDYGAGPEYTSVLVEPGAEWQLEATERDHADVSFRGAPPVPAGDLVSDAALPPPLPGEAFAAPGPPPSFAHAGAPSLRLGASLAGGAAVAGLPLFGGTEWASRSAPAAGGRSLLPDAVPPPLPGSASNSSAAAAGTEQQPPASAAGKLPFAANSSSFDCIEKTPRRDAAERGRLSSKGRPEQPAPEKGRARSPVANSRGGTPVTARSRSVTPSVGPKRQASSGNQGPARGTGVGGSVSALDRRRLGQRVAPRERNEALTSPRLVSSGSRTNEVSKSSVRSPSRGPEDDGDDAPGRSNSTPGRRQPRLRPTGVKAPESSAPEAENVQLRAEVSELRMALRGVMRELSARTEDLRDVSSLLARGNGACSTSNLADGLSSDGLGQHTGSGVQLSGICAEELLSRGSIIARLEADNERYRIKTDEQNCLLLELQSQMQAQSQEFHSVVKSQNFRNAGSEVAPVTSSPNARGKGGGALRGAGRTDPRGAAAGAVFTAQARSDGSLRMTPPPTPSPRVDARVLR